MRFTIFSIAVWRISHMLWAEAGPFNVFGRFRSIFIRENDEGGTYTRWMLGKMLLCIRCLSVWVAMPFAWYLAADLLQFVAFTTALSAMAIFINAIFVRIE